MKIAVLYICTGRYNQFFCGFYKSAEMFLLKGAEKHYFVWTDNDNIAKELKNVTIIHKECAGFPADSLFRFEMFMQVEDKLLDFDYVYFFNSNAIFLKPVGEEILPDETGLAMGIWRGKRERQHPMFYPYERNLKSLAYVAPYKPPYIYFMGGLNGGTPDKYLDLIRTLSKNIRDDYAHGIIARFHDESHINAYMRTHRCKILGRDLNSPEELMDADSKLIFRNKICIDSYFDKNRKHTKIARMKQFVGVLCDICRWYLKF